MYKISNRQTFGFSAENPKGVPNGGTKGKDCEKLNAFYTIKPGETLEVCSAIGEGMITHMWFTGYTGHGFIMRIYWDGCEFPSVEAPISAFFGCAYDEQFADIKENYPVLNSSVMLVTPARGYNSYFEMPFKKSCRITIENRTDREENLYYMISGWYGSVGDDIGYFHAAYRQERPVQKGRAYVVLDGVKGRGKFMGMTFASGMNGHNTCWVEGEAKMYIDGEQYPSMNYTGTEDYFCGAYNFDVNGEYKEYTTPYAGMYKVRKTDEIYRSQRYFNMYRWHITDPIYFKEDLKVTIQALGWRSEGRYLPLQDDISSVAYWYSDTLDDEYPALPSKNELEII